MGSLLLARGRAVTGCALAALTAGLAGCTGSAAQQGTSVAGRNLTIYLSKPPGITANQQDVIAAEQLALNQSGRQISGFTIKAVPVGGVNELSGNARAAISDPTTIAYLGELTPGSSGQTIGITNGQDTLQISPTDNAIEQTQSTPAVPGSPDLYYESLSANGRTFAHVAPSNRLEAKALIGEAASLGVKRLDIAVDGSDYGKALNRLLVGDASSAGITIVSTSAGADGVLYAGSSTGGATTAFNQAVAGSPSVKLFAPSALADDSFAAALSSAAQRSLYVISPGFTSNDLPAQAQQFESAFKAAYGHTPATDAIFGYEAMSALMSTLRRAGSSANNRGTVVKDFFDIRNRSSVLGTYSITSGGDISFAAGAPFVFSRVRGGKLVAFKAVQQQG